jgi:hypothetical protein
MTLPDFVIIGAMKSGTTTLQVQLSVQPSIFMSTPKEPNFFSDDMTYAQGTEWYEALFAHAPSGAFKGEASTHYTKLPTYPNTVTRMAALLKAPKLIYVIRDPVERAISHYIHEWTEGRISHDPISAFDKHGELIDYSCYGMQIAPFVAEFGADQIYLTSLEQLKSDPDGELLRIGAHLGMPEPLIWDHTMGAQNVSAQRVRRLPLQRLLVDNPVARKLRRTLVPKSVRTRIRTARAPKERPELPSSLRAKIEAIFVTDRAALAAVFPDHPALRLCYGFAPE